jgi:predicted signal transduction protein with EAL and GGDEF domain
VGERLAACIREGDTVARLGGDEFVLLVTEHGRDSGRLRVAQRVIKAITEPFTIDQREFKVTCSIGIASFPHDGADADTLLRNADTAMYRAKDLGRNNSQLYSAEMNANLDERLTLETDLWNALERKEFLLYYQPKVDLATGRVVGLEALLRWQHPTKGLILPERFIPIAEESSLIRRSATAIHEACRQSRVWQDRGPAMAHCREHLRASIHSGLAPPCELRSKAAAPGDMSRDRAHRKRGDSEYRSRDLGAVFASRDECPDLAR